MRIAIIGDGFIAAELARRVLAEPSVGALCALLSRRARTVDGVAPGLVVSEVAALLAREPTLVVECAHPDVSRAHGAAILARCDYLPLSLTALADAHLHDALLDTAARCGTRLLVPHGAVVGMDSLLEWRMQWRRVRITFRKHPRHIDFAGSGMAPPAAAACVYSGTVRGIAPLFPRNVNAMVACALASTGLDACEARLFADPALSCAELEIEAEGRDGSTLSIRRRQPVSGVSGSEMAASLWRSLQLAAGVAGPLAFV